MVRAPYQDTLFCHLSSRLHVAGSALETAFSLNLYYLNFNCPKHFLKNKIALPNQALTPNSNPLVMPPPPSYQFPKSNIYSPFAGMVIESLRGKF